MLTVEDLKKLYELFQICDKLNRKAELVNGIAGQIQDNLEKIWQKLDRLQKAAVAEVVHSDDNNYRDKSFVAKYGQQPNWGTGDRYSRHGQPSRLCLFFYLKLMPADLKQALLAFVPKPQATRLNEVGDRLPDTFKMQVERVNYLTSENVSEKFEFPLTVMKVERLAPRDLAALIANATLTERFCQLMGGRGLVVMAMHEGKFRNALRLLGYVLPPMK